MWCLYTLGWLPLCWGISHHQCHLLDLSHHLFLASTGKEHKEKCTHIHTPRATVLCDWFLCTVLRVPPHDWTQARVGHICLLPNWTRALSSNRNPTAKTCKPTPTESTWIYADFTWKIQYSNSRSSSKFCKLLLKPLIQKKLKSSHNPCIFKSPKLPQIAEFLKKKPHNISKIK